jgi:hypothetical protein
MQCNIFMKINDAIKSYFLSFFHTVAGAHDTLREFQKK